MNLLPRAFTKNQQTAVWIDTENNLVHVDAASSKRAEDALALLRKSLGSLPVVPLTFANEPSTILNGLDSAGKNPALVDGVRRG